MINGEEADKTSCRQNFWTALTCILECLKTYRAQKSDRQVYCDPTILCTKKLEGWTHAKKSIVSSKDLGILQKKIRSQPWGNYGYEVLATSFSQSRHMRAGGQSSPSPSYLPTDSVRSMYSSQLSSLEAQVEQKSRSKFVPWPGFERRNSRLAVQHANHQTTAQPLESCKQPIISLCEDVAWFRYKLQAYSIGRRMKCPTQIYFLTCNFIYLPNIYISPFQGITKLSTPILENLDFLVFFLKKPKKPKK